MKVRLLYFLPALALAAACACIAPPASAQKTNGAAAARKPAARKPAARKPAPKPAPKDSAKPAAVDAPASDKTGKPETSRPASSAHQVVERESRIEFDERMVRGQSAAGAIYLFQRSPSEFKSIVQVPESFRPRTVAILTPRTGTK